MSNDDLSAMRARITEAGPGYPVWCGETEFHAEHVTRNVYCSGIGHRTLRLPPSTVWIAPVGTPVNEVLKERGRLSHWFRRVVLRRPEWIEIGYTDNPW